MPSTNTPSLLCIELISTIYQALPTNFNPYLNNMASTRPSHNRQPMPRLLNRRRRFQRSIRRARRNDAPGTYGSKPASIRVDDSTPDGDSLREAHLLGSFLRETLTDGDTGGDDLLSLRRVHWANLRVLSVDQLA